MHFFRSSSDNNKGFYWYNFVPRSVAIGRVLKLKVAIGSFLIRPLAIGRVLKLRVAIDSVLKLSAQVLTCFLAIGWLLLLLFLEEILPRSYFVEADVELLEGLDHLDSLSDHLGIVCKQPPRQNNHLFASNTYLLET